jgi:hypothetical protein
MFYAIHRHQVFKVNVTGNNMIAGVPIPAQHAAGKRQDRPIGQSQRGFNRLGAGLAEQTAAVLPARLSVRRP